MTVDELISVLLEQDSEAKVKLVRDCKDSVTIFNPFDIQGLNFKHTIVDDDDKKCIYLVFK